MTEKTFPIQFESGAAPFPTSIPWHIAELAYSVYGAKHGTSQSLERLAERGGFAPSEMDQYLPDWRARCDVTVRCWTALVNIASTARKWAVAMGGDTPLALIAQMARDALRMSPEDVESVIAALSQRQDAQSTGAAAGSSGPYPSVSTPASARSDPR